MQQMQNIPKISVITASLNQGEFLREMVESTLSQTFKNFEHIVVDGGSTDNTLEILKEYSHIRWISERDESPHDALIKAFAMSKGRYIIQCCVSDGFLNKDWFKKCVEILDSDNETSLVYGLPQYMTEEGLLGRITDVHFLAEPPPQKKYFLAYWLNTGAIMFEGNQCVRREVFDVCFPKDLESCMFKELIYYDFAYNFITNGYLPYFLPVIANYGRIHKSSLSLIYRERDMLLTKEYLQIIKNFKNNLFTTKTKYLFRDGSSQIIGEITKRDLPTYKRRYYKIKLKLIMNHTIYELVRFILRKLHLYKLREWLMSW